MQGTLFSFFILLGFGTSFVSAFICPLGDTSMTLENDDNFFTLVYEKVDSWELCGLFCARSEKCLYWTWFDTKYTSKHNIHDCLLFDNNRQQHSLTGVISGEKNCPENVQPEPSCPRCAKTTDNGLLIEFTEKNLDYITFDDGQSQNYIDEIPNVGDSKLCGHLCAITTACVYWTWYDDGDSRDANTCLMFDNIVELQYNENAYSGNKYYPNSDRTEPECTPACPDPCPNDPGPGPDNAAELPSKDVTKYLGIATFVGLVAVFWM